MRTSALFIAGLAALLLAAGGAAAQGDTPEDRLRLAREHVDLFVMDEMVGEMVPALGAQLAGQIAAANTGLAPAKIEAIGARIAELTAQRVSADIPEIAAQLMADSFSAAEISALTEFYRTEHGSAIRRKLAGYNNAVLEKLVPYVMEIAPEILQQVEDEGLLD